MIQEFRLTDNTATEEKSHLPAEIQFLLTAVSRTNAALSGSSPRISLVPKPDFKAFRIAEAEAKFNDDEAVC